MDESGPLLNYIRFLFKADVNCDTPVVNLSLRSFKYFHDFRLYANTFDSFGLFLKYLVKYFDNVKRKGLFLSINDFSFAVFLKFVTVNITFFLYLPKLNRENVAKIKKVFFSAPRIILQKRVTLEDLFFAPRCIVVR